MQNTMMSQQMQSCVDSCTLCYKTCLQTAMNECLQMGGEHLQPEHFRLMMNCAEMCRLAADFMMTGSRFCREVCATCAQICEACAQSCEALGMSECASICRACADSCRRMSADETMDMLQQQDAGSPMMTGQAAHH